MSKKTEMPQPMDPSIREEGIATMHVNRKRPCWAAKTLVSEMDVLFPETPVEYSNYNLRNTALDVTFDLTTLDSTDREMAANLLELTSSDSRIEDVIVGAGDMDGQVLVSFIANPRTQDSRAPFGLGDALDVLADDDEVAL